MLSKALSRAVGVSRRSVPGARLLSTAPHAAENHASEDASAAPEAPVKTVAEFRLENEIVVRSPRGVDIPDPIMSFKNAPASILSNIKMVKEFPAPSSIQSQAWPIALDGHDIVSVAKTGL
jgi:ATP-dependent RNA helicase DDX5/DBP2